MKIKVSITKTQIIMENILEREACRREFGREEGEEVRQVDKP